MTETQKKESKIKKTLFYMIGSGMVLGIACYVIPKLSPKLTNYIYKTSIKKKNIQDTDDWGPEIVKKTDDK